VARPARAGFKLTEWALGWEDRETAMNVETGGEIAAHSVVGSIFSGS
jgi:hypothetical protein